MRTQFLGVLLLVSGFVLMYWQGNKREKAIQEYETQQSQNEPADKNVAASPSVFEKAGSAPSETKLNTKSKPNSNSPTIFQESSEAKAIKEEVTSKTKEQTYEVSNDFIKITFTNHGGAIKNVAFTGKDTHGKLQYRESLESEQPYIFNKNALMPALGISWSQADTDLKAFDPVYQLRAQDSNSIQFSLRTEQGLDIIREYTITTANDSSDPYIIKHSTRFSNPTDSSYDLKKIYLNAGTLPLTEGDNYKMHLNFGYFDITEDDVEFIKITEFISSSGPLGGSEAEPYIKTSTNPISWGAVKNQFFTGVITPEKPGSGVFVKGYEIEETNSYGENIYCITGNVEFNLGNLSPGDNKELDIQYFVGPKEYTRLAELGKNQDLVMQFGVPPFHWGPFIFISQNLLIFMKWLHSMIINVSEDWAWGLTIILFTILIKGSLWPLTAIQVRSSKKMQSIQGPMKEMKEKYKDSPQKQQQEMLKLFKENNVNPASGCLPILVQIPIFIGLFGMLRSASELRFASFLWANDLSIADSIAWLPEIPQAIPYFGGPFHILPIIMGVTMYYQMKMMPTPATDNMQVKMLKFMPLIFFLFSWKFPAGLVLYWTVNNLLTILQTRLTRDVGAVTVTASASTPKIQSKPSARKSKKSRKK